MGRLWFSCFWDLFVPWMRAHLFLFHSSLLLSLSWRLCFYCYLYHLHWQRQRQRYPQMLSWLHLLSSEVFPSLSLHLCLCLGLGLWLQTCLYHPGR